jgi:hypothetical protein
MPVCVRCGRLFFGGGIARRVAETGCQWLELPLLIFTGKSSSLFGFCGGLIFVGLSAWQSSIVSRFDAKFTMMGLVKSRFDRAPLG